MSPPAKQLQPEKITEQEYLATEAHAAVKREYIGGEVYAMAGAHRNHNHLTGNLFGEIRSHLKGQSCAVFQSDLRVKVEQDYFYPDVVVDCVGQQDYWTDTPVIIVEVLSKSTRQMDKTFKRHAYCRLPTLQEYLLIEQDLVEIEVWRRQGMYWEQSIYYLGDQLTLHSIGLTLAVHDIYERVQNPDMLEWLKQQADMPDSTDH